MTRNKLFISIFLGVLLVLSGFVNASNDYIIIKPNNKTGNGLIIFHNDTDTRQEEIRNNTFIFNSSINNSINFTTNSTIDSNELNVEINKVELKDTELSTNELTIISGNLEEALSLRVSFTANQDADDVRVSARIEDNSIIIEDGTLRFQIYKGQTYIKHLTLNLPSNFDTSKEYILHIRIANDVVEKEATYNVKFLPSQTNHAPWFLGTPAIPSCIQEGDSQGFGIQARDPDGDPITIEWYLDGVLVSNVTMTGGTNSSVGVSNGYTFVAVYEKVYAIKVIISDGKLSNQIEFDIDVGGGGCPSGIAHPIYSCQNLDIKNGVYKLQNDITTSGTCFVVKADNILLDLNGHTITGEKIGDAIYIRGYDSATIKDGIINNFSEGIEIEESNNNIIKNIEFNDNDRGRAAIKMEASSYNQIENNNFNLNDGGIYIWDGSNNIIVNNAIKNSWGNGIVFDENSNNQLIDTSILNSGHYDFYIDAKSDEQCNHILTNVIGTGNKPIAYYNNQVEINGFDVSELILCNADSSVVTDVRVDNEIQNNGMLILRTEDAVLSDIFVNNSRGGIFVKNSNNNRLTNSTSTGSYRKGLHLWNSNGNRIANSVFNNNEEEGILLTNSNNNHIENNQINNNSDAGSILNK